jgi:predicted nucleic acid-binding protein
VSAYLIDTNVISELLKPAPDPRVVGFLTREADLWLSALTLHERAFGAARVAEPGRRQRLTSWLDAIQSRFRGRWIEIDEAIAEFAGRARGIAASRGKNVTPLDSLIAATAHKRCLTLATRNLRDFEPLEVTTFDPWSG